MAIEPQIIGVVNITEDSFSDGGRYLCCADATRYALELVNAGADVIELGPASTHPHAKSVSASEEIRRVAGVVPALQKHEVTIAIDSFQPDTQRYAIAQGVAYLNDTTGFPHPEMYAELANSSAKLVVMHSILRHGRGTREVQDPASVLASIYAFFANRLPTLEAVGISRSRLIIDPGMGFFLGGNPEPSLRVLRELRRLKAVFGLPVLVSVSRKSFLGAITGRDVHRGRKPGGRNLLRVAGRRLHPDPRRAEFARRAEGDERHPWLRTRATMHLVLMHWKILRTEQAINERATSVHR